MKTVGVYVDVDTDAVIGQLNDQEMKDLGIARIRPGEQTDLDLYEEAVRARDRGAFAREPELLRMLSHHLWERVGRVL